MEVFTAYSVWVEFILDSAEVAASDGSAAIFSRTVFERLGDWSVRCPSTCMVSPEGC